MTKQLTGYPVMDQILDSIRPASANDDQWNIRQTVPGQPRAIFDHEGRLVATAISGELARIITADHNNAKDYHQSLTRLTAQRNRYWEQVEVLREALQALLECSRCQNGCAPDDMACATNKADAALTTVAEENKEEGERE